MSREEWITEQLEQAFAESRDYQQKALVLAAKKLIIEQYERIEQMKGELDGTLWSPGNWDEL